MAKPASGRRSSRAVPDPTSTDQVSPLVKRYNARSSQATRSLLIIDSSETFRAGLRSAIKATSNLIITNEADSAATLRNQGIPESIDVAVIDVDLPDQNCFLACRRLMAQRPGLALVLLSFRDEDIYLAAAHAIGAAGVLLRSSPTQQLVDALAAAADNPLFTTEQYARISTWDTTVGKPLQTLSLREWSLIWLVADGISYNEISQKLSLSQNTIERHVSSLLNKFSLSSSRQLQSFVHTHHLEVLRGLDFDDNPFSTRSKGMVPVAGF